MADAAPDVVTLGALDHVVRGPGRSLGGGRLALVTALLAHAGLFAVTWPTVTRTVVPPDGPVLRPVPLVHVVPRPPEPPSAPQLPRPPIRDFVPVPGPPPPPVVLSPADAPAIVEDVEIPWTPAEEVLPPAPPAAATGDETVVAGVDLTRPEVLHRVEPRYTETAIRTRTEGVVVLELLIGADGAVSGITVLRGLPFGLTQSAVDAARRWRFAPSELDGRPVRVRYHLTVRFELE